LTEWRKLLAGALTASICLFGLTATVGAAPSPAANKQQANGTGGGKPRIEDSKFDGQDSPQYEGRKPTDHPKLDKKLNERSDLGGLGKSRAIVVLKPTCGASDDNSDLARLGGKKGRQLGLINGHVVELPSGALRKLANNPCVASIHWDRPSGGKLNRAAVAVGARAVQRELGFDGAGVGVAIIDSGITGWHDDLTYQGSNPNVKVVNGQRVVQFVDFVNGRTAPYDDNGHGSHVAGIIAGNGYDTNGARAGIAPAADLVSLKVLDDHGGGYISNVIAALDWVVTNHSAYNVRVVNLSVGAAVSESYNTDPLTLAAKRVVDAGVVVVTAAGNLGKNPVTGKVQYGGITAPGNAPWVLTVGANSDQGTVTRRDDIMASYSSRGPTAHDYAAKPDVVAPGTGIVSLSVPGSTFYTTKAAYLLNGSPSIPAGYKAYLSLSGTSMAAPMVTGTVALMMQANPKLTPNMVKAIVEYTAQDYRYNALTQGAGFLNTKGAVELAQYLYSASPGSYYPVRKEWSKTILWANQKIKGGVIKLAGTAYAQNVVWGAAADPEGDNIVWGTECATLDCDNIVWGTSDLDADNIVWGTAAVDAYNVVWGTSVNALTHGVTWGLSEADNIVWGTECATLDCDNIVWGTTELDNIVWGTECRALDCDNIVWGTTAEADNIVWGTSLIGEVAVWGTSSESDNIVWGTSGEVTPVFDDPNNPAVFDSVDFESLFIDPATIVPLPAPVPTTTPTVDPTVATTTTVAPTTTTPTVDPTVATTTTVAPTTTTVTPVTTTVPVVGGL
jgi:serine protease AprX